MTRDAVIVSTARTAIGRAYKGAFNATPGATLGSYSLAPAIERAGIEAGILSLPTIEYRMRETRFMDDAEHAMAKASVAEDRLWFQELRGLPT